jgi:transcriptional regulator with XRE-family HTH domain
MNADMSINPTFSPFSYGDMGLRTGTGSGIGETLAQLVSRLQVSNSGESAESLETAPVQHSVPETLREIKALTGLSWGKIAELFNVSRRAVYDWLEDKPLSDSNYAALRSVFEVVEKLDFLLPYQFRTFLLFSEAGGTSPLRLLKEGRYEEFVHTALRRTQQAAVPKESSLDESGFISFEERLMARQDTVHSDLPGKKRSQASRRRPAD